MRRTFRPGLIPTLATLALLPILIGLGFWQLERSRYKQQLWDAYASGSAPASSAQIEDTQRQRFQPVTARGSYMGERQFLIDNMVRQGRNGYFVITPMQLSDGDVLLVNRGWIPQDARRRPLVDINVGDTVRTVEGRVGALPVAGIDLGDPAAADPVTWPSVRQFPDLEELAAALDAPLKSWVLLLAPQADDGFLRDWQPGGVPPSRHLGYAVQWFGLAAALLVIYLVVNLKKRPISDWHE